MCTTAKAAPPSVLRAPARSSCATGTGSSRIGCARTAAARIAARRSPGASSGSRRSASSGGGGFPSRSAARLLRPLRVLLVEVAVLLDQHLVERQPRLGDLAA